MGRLGNKYKNIKKFKVNLSAKKVKKIFKKKVNAPNKNAEVAVVDGEEVTEEVPEVVEPTPVAEPEPEPMTVASEGGKEKKLPIYRENKLRRTVLGLTAETKIQKTNAKIASRSRKQNAASAIVFRRPLTKKAARKLLRNKVYDDREAQAVAAAEEAQMQS